MVQESDFVLNIGSRFDDRSTGRMSDFIPEVRKAAEEQRGGVLHVDVRLARGCSSDGAQQAVGHVAIATQAEVTLVVAPHPCARGNIVPQQLL